MMKRILPLALMGTILAGCATFTEVSGWKGVPIFFIRTITLSPPNGGAEQCQAVMMWGGFQATLKGISKKQGTQASQSLPVTVSAMTATDSVTPGATYTYVATFDSGDPLTRTITPFTAAEAGTLAVASPKDQSTTTSKPTFTWTKNSGATPSGYMLSVAKVSSATPGSMPSASDMTPAYTAFLDGASHSTSVEYGTPSDMKALTTEITTALGSLDPRFAKKDAGAAGLTAGTYVWLISPLKVDADAINIAVGNQAFGFFQVQ